VAGQKSAANPADPTFRSWSPRLRRCAHLFQAERPVLDAGCGAGRNALPLARLGLRVVCADRDKKALGKLHSLARAQASPLPLHPVCVTLTAQRWPFARACFSGIICVHFLELELLPAMRSSLAPGGLLYIETIGGQGENHLDLPAAGSLRRFLTRDFEFIFYEERPAGPVSADKSAVKLLARRLFSHCNPE
jgi:SAM-dependent methyltransferase